MKRISSFFALFALLLLTVQCTLLEPPAEEPYYGNGIMTVKFIQINDVYEIAPLGGGKYGGMARVAYVVDSIRDRYPNTYLFMAGDFLNPSLLGSMKLDGEAIKGKQMVEVMNAMDFDLVTFGNHEFDLSEEELQQRLNESTFPWISSNVRHVVGDEVKPFETKLSYGTEPISDYKILSAKDELGNEIRLGFFALTLNDNQKEYVDYGIVYKEAQRVYDILQPQTDFIIGLTHLSIDQDRRVAQVLPDVPLIMGGHEHYSMLERENNTVIAKADANAKSLYIHSLNYNLRTQVLHVNSKIMYLDEKVPLEPSVTRIVNRWNTVLETKMNEIGANPDEVIFTPPTPLDGTDNANRSIQTNLGGIITASMSYAWDYDVDAAIVNGGSFRVDDMLQGPLTPTDVYRVLPFGGDIKKVAIRGELLKRVLDYGKSQRGNGAYLQRHNIGQDETGAWTISGKRISDRRTYQIAMSDFLLKGYDIPFLTNTANGVRNVTDPKEESEASDIRKAVISYLRLLSKE
ncbi:bifunctional metallophosphatase/5'-nucleotidase [Flavobacteriaceae bacterium TK19130]|nr:bifunctional metallophosphatase/5'-nucleotidase [Thermobacterium salinum]